MQLALVLAATIATAATAVFNRSETLRESNAADFQCREPFVPYGNLCLFNENCDVHTYQQAVTLCSRLGAFAPSLHSKEDFFYWSDALEPLNVSPDHFWLNAYCPSAGEKYVWLDGTETDYLGEEEEFKSCVPGHGYHVEGGDELEENDYDEPAPALCVYDPRKPITTQCSCAPANVYLDIVFVVDASDTMTKERVDNVTTTIKSTLTSLSLGTARYQSNVAAIAYAESVQKVVDFGDFKSSEDISSFSIPFLGGKSDKLADAIKQASVMISTNGRASIRGVIVLITNSYDQLQAADITEASNLFENNGGIVVSIDYSQGSILSGLRDIASSGFYINNISPSLDSEILHAFCDANCFCKDGLTPYNVQNERGRDLPNGCYRVIASSADYQAAKENCKEQGGFVATVHDDAKNFFLMSLFPQKTKYWLGLQRNGESFDWADGSSDAYTSWAPSNPVVGADCAYAQQQTGFNSLWFSTACSDSLSYACQLRPCDSTYDCST